MKMKTRKPSAPKINERLMLLKDGSLDAKAITAAIADYLRAYYGIHDEDGSVQVLNDSRQVTIHCRHPTKKRANGEPYYSTVYTRTFKDW